MSTQELHHSVMLDEVVQALDPQSGNWIVDATFGRGGHTTALLAAGAKVIAFDCDQDAITYGETNFAQEIQAQKLILIWANFDHLKMQLQKHSDKKISGVFFDFGVSSPQLADQEKGISFQGDGPLDMRFDTRLGVQAKDLLAILPENQLADLFLQQGGETFNKQIAKAIVRARAQKPLETVQELVEVISQVKQRRGEYLHPATKVFQALRMAVNSELQVIETALPQALELLEPGGQLVTIAFHEGEDRIVKQFFRAWEKQGKGIDHTHQVITPTDLEVASYPRSRSAKLRHFQKKDL